ncbi:hypothetical protein ARZXY2_4464 (plasmid) [Arthrobacter sp. ZXY-2]|nr:hypothetical protein ARZXY2_4464 [Arthrobacter sp. ZXY-2]
MFSLALEGDAPLLPLPVSWPEDVPLFYLLLVLQPSPHECAPRA